MAIVNYESEAEIQRLKELNAKLREENRELRNGMFLFSLFMFFFFFFSFVQFPFRTFLPHTVSLFNASIQ
jgi:hypothetical protein